MTLPVVQRAIEIGGRTWLVETVDDQDALLAAADGRAQFPFGLMLWESAEVLARALIERRSTIKGKSVLELGAGLGLSGVVAASLGARVVQTDHDASALQACARTASLNGVKGIVCRGGDWHDWHDAELYDLIVGADVIYDERDHAAVLAILAGNLVAGGRAMLADPARHGQAAFVDLAAAAGWAVATSLQPVAGSPAVALLELSRDPA